MVRTSVFSCSTFTNINRAFGSFTTFFLPPPIPKCRPPPRHHMLPCPHHASHLVVSAATVAATFGGGFNEQFEDPRKMEVYRQKPIFDLARAGYEELFKLRSDDALYVQNRLVDLYKQTHRPESAIATGTVVGMHVRHGDKHPYEFQYRDSYVPLDRFSAKAKELLQKEYEGKGPDGGMDSVAEKNSVLVVASDDPDVYTSEEFAGTIRAQDLIALAARPDSPPSGPPSAIRRFIDETPGWEGGFFAGMFWSLGHQSSTAMEAPETSLPPSEETFRLRELVARAYLMDLSVLGSGSDKVICTVSSMGCRLLAVMMGWEQAIVKGGWVNIDGDFQWRGISW
jgi:hypothetical protein